MEVLVLDAVTVPPVPVNEPVRSYPPGSPERASLEARLKELAADRIDLPMTIGGEQRMGSGARVDVVQPHNRHAVLGTLGDATTDDVRAAVTAAKAAAPTGGRCPLVNRGGSRPKAPALRAGRGATPPTPRPISARRRPAHK